jgi:hypothetical protein
LRRIKGGKVKRIQVTFTEEQWSLIERFKGVMGSEDAEVIRNIILAWLAEKSVITERVKVMLRGEKPEEGSTKSPHQG